MSKGKTTIANNLQHVTKMIDPASGQVIAEGSTPTETVGAFRANGGKVPKAKGQTEERIDKLEEGINEIKDLLKGLNK